MHVRAVKTPRITAGMVDLLELLDQALPTLTDGSIVAITSKLVSLCEGSVIPIESVDKEALIAEQSERYLPASFSKYGHHFTITGNTLVGVAGIDESNGNGNYILWPTDVQATANHVRHHLTERHGLKHLGVVITDSTSYPLRRGTTGVMLAYSGFRALNNYIGQEDLFGRPFAVSQANVAMGIASAAVVQMGEGTEQTPLAILTDISFVNFEDRDPSAEEIAAVIIPLEDDLFAPFLEAAPWQKGKRFKG